MLRSTTDLDPKFLFYLTIASDFRAIGAAMMDGAAGQKRVPQSFLENIAIGIPPLSEQRAIAAFLDRETARLDALIAKKERLLALLAEKRAALDQPRGDEGAGSERADARFGESRGWGRFRRIGRQCASSTLASHVVDVSPRRHRYMMPMASIM